MNDLDQRVFLTTDFGDFLVTPPLLHSEDA